MNNFILPQIPAEVYISVPFSTLLNGACGGCVPFDIAPHGLLGLAYLHYQMSTRYKLLS